MGKGISTALWIAMLVVIAGAVNKYVIRTVWATGTLQPR